jgi:hypothetical protein
VPLFRPDPYLRRKFVVKVNFENARHEYHHLCFHESYSVIENRRDGTVHSILAKDSSVALCHGGEPRKQGWTLFVRVVCCRRSSPVVPVRIGKSPLLFLVTLSSDITVHGMLH